METAGVEPTSPRCKRGALPPELHPQGRSVRTGGVEPPQPEATGLQPAELTMLSVRVGGAADRARTGTARITTSNAAVTPQPPRAGTTGVEPAAYRLTSERSAVELRPREWRGWDSNPRSRAHEAREDSRSSTALRARSGRLESNQRSPVPETGGVASPLQPDEYPRRELNPRLRVENPASLPSRPRGHVNSRRSWNRTTPCSSSASRAATDTDLRRTKLRRQDSNLRDAINSRVSGRSTTPE